jgi:hypothetical protein
LFLLSKFCRLNAAKKIGLVSGHHALVARSGQATTMWRDATSVSEVESISGPPSPAVEVESGGLLPSPVEREKVARSDG